MPLADINITNNECIYMRQISDRIFIWCMQGSDGLLTGYSFSLWHRSGRLLTEYSFGVCRDLVDYWLNIQLAYEWVRWIANQIFSWCMWGAGRLLTEYSFGVWMGQVDCWPNIHLVYAGVRQITNWIFINWARWIGIEYLIVSEWVTSGTQLGLGTAQSKSKDGMAIYGQMG
jgi:hypothetical protein